MDEESNSQSDAGAGSLPSAPGIFSLSLAPDRGDEKRLLPFGRLARAIKPRIGRLARTSKGGNDLGSGKLGKRFGEGHGQTIPEKEMYAMQKIILVLCLQCGHSKRMTAPTYRHGIDYTLLISPITMPNAIGEGYHSDYMLERIWNEDEEGSVLINTLHIGREHECRTMMGTEKEEGLTIQ